ncbi:MAG: isoprenylcysteine carboxylmethyltransferase family protein [Candidatus Promineifilaceae bacterium]
MVTGLHLTFSLFVVIAIFYGMHFWFIRKYDPFREKGSAGEFRYTILGLAVCLFLILQPTLLPVLGLYTDASWGMNLQTIGLLVFFSSLLLHWWARSNLQEYFGERIEVQKGQYLIESGPYAYVRHPIYLSFFIFGLGLLLLNPALPVVLILAYIFWDYGRLVSEEEKMLGDKIPGYQEYINRTSRFFPLPGKRPKEQS